MKDPVRAGGAIIATFDATIKEYLKEIDEADLLTWEQEVELGKRITQDNDQEARDRLVRSNLRLVVNIAKRYAGRGMGLGDLIEEGNLGLIKAVDYFDPDRGTRFSTYATWWIKQSIKRALLENFQPVHVPTYMVALISQWRRIAMELETNLGRRPDIHEMADVMHIPMKKAHSIGRIVELLTGSADQWGGDASDELQSFESTVEDKQGARPGEELEAFEERAKAVKLLDQIDCREAQILRLHYGLADGAPMSLKDIGDQMGLTRERIRQIRRDALHKLYVFMNES